MSLQYSSSPKTIRYRSGWSIATQALEQCRRRPVLHLTVDQYVHLIACGERESGMATLDEISRAVPCMLQPISAVFDLCDAGVITHGVA